MTKKTIIKIIGITAIVVSILANGYFLGWKRIEQNIYDLKQENQMLKDELCNFDNHFSWCR